jgi:hypothetical protein
VILTRTRLSLALFAALLFRLVLSQSAMADSPVEIARKNRQSLQSQIEKMNAQITKIRQDLEKARADRVANTLGALTGERGTGGPLESDDEADARDKLHAAEDYQKGLKKDLKTVDKAIHKWEKNNGAPGRDTVRDVTRDGDRPGRPAPGDSTRESTQSSRPECPVEHHHGGKPGC